MSTHTLRDLYKPLNPEQLENPYPIYALARKQEPIFFTDSLLADAGVFVVSRYEDILAVVSQPDLFLSKDTLRPVVPFYPSTFPVLMKGFPQVPFHVCADGDNHKRFRIPLTKTFGAQRIKLLEPFIRNLVNKLIASFINDKQAEIIKQFAYPLPLEVILHLFGIPNSDLVQTKKWTDDWSSLVSAPLTPERQIECAQSLVDYQQYLARLVNERREHPRENDMVTDLLQHSEPGQEALNDIELVNALGGLLLAGHETTTNLIGNALRILLSTREHWENICQHPELISQTVEEILRFDPPVQTFFRTAAQDTTLKGVTIPAGSLLLILYGSANRDEEHFTQADTFDPQRNGQHLAFGHGKHFCVGAPLARIEARIALEELSRQLPTLQLAKEQSFSHEPSLMFRGYQQLYVQW